MWILYDEADRKGSQESRVLLEQHQELLVGACAETGEAEESASERGPEGDVGAGVRSAHKDNARDTIENAATSRDGFPLLPADAEDLQSIASGR